MEDEEFQKKNNYSAIKEINYYNEKTTPECINLLKFSDKNSTTNISKNFQLENKVEVNYGKNKILLYHKGEPLIVLGPHCIYFLLFYLNFFEFFLFKFFIIK